MRDVLLQTNTDMYQQQIFSSRKINILHQTLMDMNERKYELYVKGEATQQNKYPNNF